MPKISAGILPYRWRDEQLEVFLVHPGGPFWAKKDAAGWSIAKGEVDEAEDLLDAARREFTEETGFVITAPLRPIGAIKASGKVIHAWASSQDFDPASLHSNTFKMEWPPRSGNHAEFPEIDRASWFTLDVAAEKLHRGQIGFLEKLRLALG